MSSPTTSGFSTSASIRLNGLGTPTFPNGKERGSLSYAQFGERVGLSHTTLHRIERGEHHLALHKLKTVLVKLKIHLKDVFPGEF